MSQFARISFYSRYIFGDLYMMTRVNCVSASAIECLKKSSLEMTDLIAMCRVGRLNAAHSNHSFIFTSISVFDLARSHSERTGNTNTSHCCGDYGAAACVLAARCDADITRAHSGRVG